MGGGRKHSSDAAKGPPQDPLRALFGQVDGLGAPSGGDAIRAYRFCDEPHRVSFVIRPGATPVAGMQVRLMAGDPPVVVADDAAIGDLQGPIAVAINGCLEMGYEIDGTVAHSDLTAGTGTLDVQGERREVAKAPL
jgi:hypothetical protein